MLQLLAGNRGIRSGIDPRNSLTCFFTFLVCQHTACISNRGWRQHILRSYLAVLKCGREWVCGKGINRATSASVAVTSRSTRKNSERRTDGLSIVCYWSSLRTT